MDPVLVTWLESGHPAELNPAPCNDPDFHVMRVAEPDGAINQALYLAVGGDWAWSDKRNWDQDSWQKHAANPLLHTYVARHGNENAGYFELLQCGDEVDILYFGLLPGFIGRGLGGVLLTKSIREAWALQAKRVTVNTCSLDHPSALRNYLARGMRIVKTGIRPPA
jgi:GNAT superfamily N-acetyltransferase